MNFSSSPVSISPVMAPPRQRVYVFIEYCHRRAGHALVGTPPHGQTNTPERLLKRDQSTDPDIARPRLRCDSPGRSYRILPREDAGKDIGRRCLKRLSSALASCRLLRHERCRTLGTEAGKRASVAGTAYEASGSDSNDGHVDLCSPPGGCK
jgi:hypothetical protein